MADCVEDWKGFDCDRTGKEFQMAKIALVYGGIAGLIVVATIFIGFVLEVDHGDGGLLLGYSIMIVALTQIRMWVLNPAGF